jgi:preprotein translocase subunit SecE
LKKVHWPDRRALVMYTVVVLIAVALVSGLLWLLDNIIGFLLDLVFKAFA